MYKVLTTLFLMTFSLSANAAFRCKSDADVAYDKAEKIAYETNCTDPKETATHITDGILEVLNAKISTEEKFTYLSQIVDAYVAEKYVTRFVSSGFWRDMSDDQKERFYNSFHDYIRRSYKFALNAFGQNTDIKSQFISSQPKGSKFYTATYNVSYMQPNGSRSSVELVYMMRKSGELWKLFDVSVSGLSMAYSQRSEFASYVEENGVEALIDFINNGSVIQTD